MPRGFTLFSLVQRRVGSHLLSLVSVNKKIASWEATNSLRRSQSWSTPAASPGDTGCPGIGISILTPCASYMSAWHIFIKMREQQKKKEVV
jgi:hypothetical protein